MNYFNKILSDHRGGLCLSFGSRPKAKREMTSKNIFAGILQNNGGEEQRAGLGAGLQGDD